MSNQINLADKTIDQLKVIAYDVAKAINNYSQILNVVNNEINEREAQASLKREADKMMTKLPTAGVPEIKEFSKKDAGVF